MKTKLLFPIVALVLLLTACQKEDAPELNGIQIRFHNTMNQNISDSYYVTGIDTIIVGEVPANGFSPYVAFPALTTGDGLPMGSMTGVLGIDILHVSAGLWCGTGVTFADLQDGLYTIKITDYEWQGHHTYFMEFE